LAALYKCSKKFCKSDLQDVCGNGLCHGESTKCPKDCPAVPVVCGNGLCQGSESSQTCPGDCGPVPDVAACRAKHCGVFETACKNVPSCGTVMGCEKNCPLTADWKNCVKGCLGKANLFGFWTWLPLDECGKKHGCRPQLPAFCGDSTCQASETATSCQQDCFEPQQCGDGWCAAAESVQSCPADCATCETTGCGGKPGLVCCKVSGKLQCTAQPTCDE